MSSGVKRSRDIPDLRRFKIQDSKIQDLKIFLLRGTDCKSAPAGIQDLRFKIQDSKIQDSKRSCQI